MARSKAEGADARCLFCRVVAREVEAAIVFEDQDALGFLDHRPLFPGHCLLIPKEHRETLADLPVGSIGPFFRSAQALSAAVERAMRAEGSFVAINNRVSQSVSHLHVHIVPRTKGDGLRGFFWPRQKYKDEAHLRETQAAIQAALSPG